jgi:hypothetical protein
MKQAKKIIKWIQVLRARGMGGRGGSGILGRGKFSTSWVLGNLCMELSGRCVFGFSSTNYY